MTDSLQKLFGSAARVKLLRLFLFNPLQHFTIPEAAKRAQVEEKVARVEITDLRRIGLLKRDRRGTHTRFLVDDRFSYLLSLQNLLLNVESRAEEVKKRFRKTGSIKLIIIAGMFVGEWEGDIDILIVGDRMKSRAFRTHLKKMEAEIGREIRYTLLSSTEFLYRLNMSDKLLRDVFDYPHRIILDTFDMGLN